MIVYPARTIESDVVLVASDKRQVINRDIRFEDSDHYQLRSATQHQALYRPKNERTEVESW
jgi:hypothetical protein